MLDIELIKAYIRMKQIAEHYIGHRWEDEELKEIVKEKISNLNIELLLEKAVESADTMKCPECNESIRTVTLTCPKCRWENPLAWLQLVKEIR